MRKVLLLFIMTLSIASIEAGPVGSPAAPRYLEEGFFISPENWFSLRIGYEGNFVSDARMKQRRESSGRVDDFEVDMNSGTITLNLRDRFDIFTVLGAAKISSDWRINPAVGTVARIDTETDYRFAWAIGARAVLFEWGNTTLGVGGRYQSMDPKVEYLTTDGVPVPTNSAKIRYREWQVDAGLSHRIGIFIPYVGVKYFNARSRVRTITATPIANDGGGSVHMKNRTPVGIVVGTTLTTGKEFALTIEGRLIDEEAVTITGELRF